MADLLFGGGLNETDQFSINIEDCTLGQNFILDARARTLRPRRPQQKLATATNGAEITSICQLTPIVGAPTTLVAAGDTLYVWDWATTFTSKKTITIGSRLRCSHWALDDFLVLTDLELNEPLYKWDGSNITRLKHGLTVGGPVAVTGITRSASLATVAHTGHGYATGDLVTIAGADQAAYNGQHEITVTSLNAYTFPVVGSPATPATGTITADFGVSMKAKYSIVYQGRVWLFNVEIEGMATPHAVLASAFENAENYDSATRAAAGGITASDPFLMLTPDLHPINGVAVFYDRLVISTDNDILYVLTGSDATDYAWQSFYAGSGATGDEAMVNIGNDVLFMRRGGAIDRLSGTDRFGDVTTDDLTRWIPNTTGGLTNAIAVYDRTEQRVLWFVDDGVLVLDKELMDLRQDVSPWMVYKTSMPNQFNTKAAGYFVRQDRPGYAILWGDCDGKIFDLDGENYQGDEDLYSILMYRRSRRINEIDTIDALILGQIEYQRRGECVCQVKATWNVAYTEGICDVPLKGPIITGVPKFFDGEDEYFNDDDYFNEGVVSDTSVADDRVSETGFSMIGRGPGFFLTLTVDSVRDYLINRIAL